MTMALFTRLVFKIIQIFHCPLPTYLRLIFGHLPCSHLPMDCPQQDGLQGDHIPQDGIRDRLPQDSIPGDHLPQDGIPGDRLP